jgi:hypothetical protein
VEEKHNNVMKAWYTSLKQSTQQQRGGNGGQNPPWDNNVINPSEKF